MTKSYKIVPWVILLTAVLFSVACEEHIKYRWGEVPEDASRDIFLESSVSEGWFQDYLYIYSLNERKCYEVFKHNERLRNPRWSSDHGYITFIIFGSGQSNSKVYLLDLKKQHCMKVYELGDTIIDAFYNENEQSLYIAERPLLEKYIEGKENSLNWYKRLVKVRLPDYKKNIVWDASDWVSDENDWIGFDIYDFDYFENRQEIYMHASRKSEGKRKYILGRLDLRRNKFEIFENIPDETYFTRLDENGDLYFYSYSQKKILKSDRDLTRFEEIYTLDKNVSFSHYSFDQKCQRVAFTKPGKRRLTTSDLSKGVTYPRISRSSFYILDIRTGKLTEHDVNFEIVKIDW